MAYLADTLLRGYVYGHVEIKSGQKKTGTSGLLSV
jgi:hypothetical protein